MRVLWIAFLNQFPSRASAFFGSILRIATSCNFGRLNRTTHGLFIYLYNEARVATLLPFLPIPANFCFFCVAAGIDTVLSSPSLYHFFTYIRPFYCMLKHFTSEVEWGTYGQGKQRNLSLTISKIFSHGQVKEVTECSVLMQVFYVFTPQFISV